MSHSQTQKHKAIIDASVDVIWAHGYHGSSLSMLLEASDTKKGSFYHFFEDKNKLFEEVIIKYADLYLEMLEDSLRKEKNQVKALSYFFNSLVEMFGDLNYSKGCLLGNLAAEMADDVESCRKALYLSFERLETKFKEIIIYARKEGMLNVSGDDESIANVIINLWEGALLRMKTTKTSIPLESSIEYIFRNIFNSNANH